MKESIGSIAVLGTGIMGRPMAANLLRAGFGVAAWNRTRAKAAPLADLGATIADTPAEAVRDADVVLTMLENGPVVTEVIFGGGAVTAARRGSLFIDMSSIQPSLARDHAQLLAEQGHRYLDAPVSGGETGAIEATLAIMVGGETADFEQARPLFDALGRPTRVGPHGAGQLAKLCNQQIVAVTIGAVSEALLLAAAGGADPAAVREAIRGGFAESRVLELHGQRMIARDWRPGGLTRTHLKDMNNVLEVARELGLTLPLTEQTRDTFDRLSRMEGGGELDHSACLLLLEAMNPPHRVGLGPDRRP